MNRHQHPTTACPRSSETCARRRRARHRGAVYAALNPARAVVCTEPPLLRFGDFAARVQARAEDLRGERPMQAVMEIERELVLEPYEDIEGFERRVLAFPPEIVLGVWAQQLTTPPAELTAISEALLPAIDAPLLSLHGSQPPEDYPSWLTGLAPTAEVEVWEGMPLPPLGRSTALCGAPALVPQILIR